LDQRGLAFVKQHATHTAVGRVQGRHIDRSQIVSPKHPEPDVCDAAGDRNAGPGVTKSSNAGDGQKINCAGDDHRADGAGVAGDGDGAVIGNVSELRLRLDGQRQEQLQGADSS
jgi:hypothetical protein